MQTNSPPQPVRVTSLPRMPSGLRLAIFGTFGLLWASGCCWLILHWFLERPTDFGMLAHPWEPAVLRIHGWLAVGSVFLLGWVTSVHVTDRWPRTIKRFSGVLIFSVACVLAISGYALYYTTDRLHDRAGVVHELVGIAALLFALIHWRRYRGWRPLRRS